MRRRYAFNAEIANRAFAVPHARKSLRPAQPPRYRPGRAAAAGRECQNRDGRPSGKRISKLPVLGTASWRIRRTRVPRDSAVTGGAQIINPLGAKRLGTTARRGVEYASAYFFGCCCSCLAMMASSIIRKRPISLSNSWRSGPGGSRRTMSTAFLPSRATEAALLPVRMECCLFRF